MHGCLVGVGVHCVGSMIEFLDQMWFELLIIRVMQFGVDIH